MNEETKACPYCNAQLPPAAAGLSHCPRCGEWLGRGQGRLSANPSEQTAADSVTTCQRATFSTSTLHIRLALVSISILLLSLGIKLTMPNSNTAQRGFPFIVLLSGMGLVGSLWLWFFRKPRDNNSIGLFVLGNMACVALMVLPLAVTSEKIRRDHDPKPPPTTTIPAKVQSVAPGELEALGWLPEDCNLVAGIHVAELLAKPEGAKLLTTQKEAESEQGPWLIEQGIVQVEKLTGLKLTQIDHLALALRQQGVLPQVVIVVRTKQPYDRAALAETQKPVVAVRTNGGDLYQLAKPPGLIYCADPQTLLVVIGVVIDGDKELLKSSPRTGAEKCPVSMRELVNKRLSGNPQLWWAANATDLMIDVDTLLPLSIKEAALQKKANSLAVGVRMEKDALLQGSVEFTDPVAAHTFAASLEKQKFDGLGTPKVTAHEPEFQFQSGRWWVSWQLQGRPERLTALLRGVRFK